MKRKFKYEINGKKETNKDNSLLNKDVIKSKKKELKEIEEEEIQEEVEEEIEEVLDKNEQ